MLPYAFTFRAVGAASAVKLTVEAPGEQKLCQVLRACPGLEKLTACKDELQRGSSTRAPVSAFFRVRQPWRMEPQPLAGRFGEAIRWNMLGQAPRSGLLVPAAKLFVPLLLLNAQSILIEKASETWPRTAMSSSAI